MFSYSPFNQDISTWDVSNVTQMEDMFWNNEQFNQDLSGWCVSLIPTEPNNFYAGATSWVLPKPVWGTCP
jgi:surface protein